METIVLGAGCFWCIQSVVDKWQGIISSIVGYSGGHIINPTYGNLCLGNSGHTEVIEINFNPKIISLKEVIEKFFEIHDYTKEEIEQYKSIIFYNDLEQKNIIEEAISELNSSNIKTEIRKSAIFYKAEEEHQKYAEKKYGSK